MSIYTRYRTFMGAPHAKRYVRYLQWTIAMAEGMLTGWRLAPASIKRLGAGIASCFWATLGLIANVIGLVIIIFLPALFVLSPIFSLALFIENEYRRKNFLNNNTWEYDESA